MGERLVQNQVSEGSLTQSYPEADTQINDLMHEASKCIRFSLGLHYLTIYNLA
jgi:hypothetical protein